MLRKSVYNYIFAIIFALLAVTMVFAFRQPVYAVSWSGDGSIQTPYEIANADQLMELATYVNQGNDTKGKYFKLTNNINLEGKNWVPIGNVNANHFKGVFLGDNHIISNLTITSPNTYNGLFGYLSAMSGAVITNFTLKDIDISGRATNAYCAAGGVVGYVDLGCPELDHYSIPNYNQVKISEVSVEGGAIDLISDFTTPNLYVGGIVGCAEYQPYEYTETLSIKHCWTNLDLSGVTTDNSTGSFCKVNGILGYGFALIDNCFAIGNTLIDDVIIITSGTTKLNVKWSYWYDGTKFVYYGEEAWKNNPDTLYYSSQLLPLLQNSNNPSANLWEEKDLDGDTYTECALKNVGSMYDEWSGKYSFTIENSSFYLDTSNVTIYSKAYPYPVVNFNSLSDLQSYNLIPEQSGLYLLGYSTTNYSNPFNFANKTVDSTHISWYDQNVDYMIKFIRSGLTFSPVNFTITSVDSSNLYQLNRNVDKLFPVWGSIEMALNNCVYKFYNDAYTPLTNFQITLKNSTSTYAVYNQTNEYVLKDSAGNVVDPANFGYSIEFRVAQIQDNAIVDLNSYYGTASVNGAEVTLTGVQTESSLIAILVPKSGIDFLIEVVGQEDLVIKVNGQPYVAGENKVTYGEKYEVTFENVEEDFYLQKVEGFEGLNHEIDGNKCVITVNFIDDTTLKFVFAEKFTAKLIVAAIIGVTAVSICTIMFSYLGARIGREM